MSPVSGQCSLLSAVREHVPVQTLPNSNTFVRHKAQAYRVGGWIVCYTDVTCAGSRTGWVPRHSRLSRNSRRSRHQHCHHHHQQQ